MRFLAHVIRGPRAISAARGGATLYVINERGCWIEAGPEVFARAIRVEEAHEAQVYGVEECPETLARIAGVEWAERLWKLAPGGTWSALGMRSSAAEEAECSGIEPRHVDALNGAARMRWDELVKMTDPKRYVLADSVVAAWRLLRDVRFRQGKPYEASLDSEGWLLACRPEGATLDELAARGMPPARVMTLIAEGVLIPEVEHGR